MANEGQVFALTLAEIVVLSALLCSCTVMLRINRENNKNSEQLDAIAICNQDNIPLSGFEQINLKTEWQTCPSNKKTQSVWTKHIHQRKFGWSPTPKQQNQKLSGSSSSIGFEVRSWSEFGDGQGFAVPEQQVFNERVTTNLVYYHANYAIIFILFMLFVW
jgi:hypothetical protein